MFCGNGGEITGAKSTSDRSSWPLLSDLDGSRLLPQPAASCVASAPRVAGGSPSDRREARPGRV